MNVDTRIPRTSDRPALMARILDPSPDREEDLVAMRLGRRLKVSIGDED